MPSKQQAEHVSANICCDVSVLQDGLWECSFCSTVCSSSDVGFDFCGHLTLQQHTGPPHPQLPAQAHSHLPETGVRPGSGIGGPPDQQVWHLGADAAALAVVAGTSAEAWRLQGQTAASTQLARKVSATCPERVVSAQRCYADQETLAGIGVVLYALAAGR